MSAMKKVSESLRLALRSRRRGSFIVLVVGTLAMMSIIMIVYVAIGNADKRVSTSLARRDRSDEMIGLFGDYVAQVVADDAVSVSADPSNWDAKGNLRNLKGGTRYLREAWDVPATNWQVSSAITDRNSPLFFRATGTGDDPWLASTTPTWINFDAAKGTAPTPTDKTFAKRRDWLHITNIAPDGRFINLNNLRDNFDAKPGTSMAGGDVHTNGNLSLTDPTGKPKELKTAWNQQVDAGAVSTDNYQNPTTFDSWQVGAFRPARGPFKDGGADISPSDPWYPPNQWADADGDGFLDSRWFEMVDARDATNSSVSAPQFFRNLLPRDPNYRWVFAARIIDLSSLVNVNTAGDSLADPNDTGSDAGKTLQAKGNVIGLNPADVDLRRLLSMRDFRETVLNSTTPTPIQLNDGTILRNYDGGYMALRQPPGGKPASQDYSNYGDGAANVLPGTTLTATQDFAWGGYESLRATLNLGRPPGKFSNFTIDPLLTAKDSFKTIAARRDFYSKAAPSVARPAYRDLISGERTTTRLSKSGGAQVPVTGAIDYGLGFKTNNLIELLTYRSVNDSEVTSSLEAALGGQRWSKMDEVPTQAEIGAPSIPFSPLRDNRSTLLEREGLAYVSGANAGQPTDSAMLRSYTDLRQYLTTLSGARPIVPTVVTAITPDDPPELTSSDLSTYVPSNPTARELFSAYAKALLPGLSFYQPDASMGTKVEIWKDVTAPGDSQELRGMFYGGQGPMTALLAAGHMAANFVSSAQPIAGNDAIHAPFVLLLGEQFHDNVDGRLPANLTAGASWKQYYPSWWAHSDRQLNLGRAPVVAPATKRSGQAKLPVDIANEPVPAPAVNIYGVGDAHPFLVEVAAMTVYRDTPPLKTDARGANTAAAPETALMPYPDPTYTYITVNGNVDDPNNPDFVVRLFAVKVHNPFGQPIQLSDQSFKSTGLDATRSDQFQANKNADYFYLKVGLGSDSKAYVLAEVDEKIANGEFDGTYDVKPVTILPGETIVFYALSESCATVAWERIGHWNRQTELNGNTKKAVNLTQWLDKQLPPAALPKEKGIRRVQMLRTDDRFDDSRPGKSFQVSMASFARDTLTPKKGSDQTVMLMRSLVIDSGTLVNDAASTANSVKNDRLCDRMRLGTAFNLDRQLNGTPANQPETFNVRVDGLRAPIGIQKEDLSTSNSANRNTRFMVTIGACVRRPGDPSGAIVPGMIPAWAIDPKDIDATSWYSYKEVPTRGSGVTPSPFQLVSGDLDSTKSGMIFWGYRPQEWETGEEALFATLKQQADSYSPGAKIADPAGGKFEDIRRELGANHNKYQGYSASASSSNPGDGISQIRPTDLLNVMAIGSTQVPIDVNGNPINDGAGNPDWKRQWTTTAESLAMAMGYGSAPANATAWQNPSSVYGPLDYYYHDFYSIVKGKPTKAIFDSGYLRTDDFVSVRYDSSDKPYTAGTGGPIAGNVLSMFRTQPDDFASLNIATPGLVNINTAPQAVLRVLPMTFPATNKLVATGGGTTFWAGADEGERSDAAMKVDIAAMIESYRDKIAVELRPGAKGPTNTKMPSWFAGFVDRSAATFTTPNAQDKGPNDADVGSYSNLPTYVGGRYWSNGLKGVRESAGFQTPGDLFGVRHVEFNPSDGTVTTTASDLGARTSNIDSLGHRPVGSKTNMLGIDNIVEQSFDVSNPSAPVLKDIQPLQFGHTYQDKLKVLSGMLGSISVRSDMYAAWFIVRGYQRSDVEGLPANQPMVPSIERRFLMIIDRSNVTKVGQKPRILAFVEVPL